MDGSYGCRWLPVVAFFVAYPAWPQAQSTVASVEPLTADPASYVPSGHRPGNVVTYPIQPPTPEEKGDAYMLHKSYQAAIEAYTKIEQPSAAVWNKTGIAYQMMFDLKDAARCYKESLKLEPDNSHTLNNLATVEESQGDFSGAERNYKKSLRLNSRSAIVWQNLGTTLLLQHQFGRGTDAYAQALAIDPHIFDTHPGPTVTAPAATRERGTTSYFKARTCARAGFTDCALSHLRKAFNEGFATVKTVANEVDFDSLRGKPEFESLLAEQK